MARRGTSTHTELLFGRRVRKDDVRIEALGALDELNAFLGLAKCSTRRKQSKQVIGRCQRDLFVLASEVAALPRDLDRLKVRMEQARLEALETEIRRLTGGRRSMDADFAIPGARRSGALLDVCRCVARRAERRVIAIRKRMAVPKSVLTYLNRLSTLLYLLARSEEERGTRADGGKSDAGHRSTR